MKMLVVNIIPNYTWLNLVGISLPTPPPLRYCTSTNSKESTANDHVDRLHHPFGLTWMIPLLTMQPTSPVQEYPDNQGYQVTTNHFYINLSPHWRRQGSGLLGWMAPEMSTGGALGFRLGG